MTSLVTTKPLPDQQLLAPTPPLRPVLGPEAMGSWQLLFVPIAICLALLTYVSLTF